MKKKLLVVLTLVALAAVAGCKKEDTNKPPQGAMPPAAMPGGQGGDPHAGIKPQEIPAGVGHKGKVVSSLQAGQWTYVEIDENGKKVWVAVPKIDVKPGTVVEFPDSPPMVNFQSKELNRKFDSVIFAPGLRIQK